MEINCAMHEAGGEGGEKVCRGLLGAEVGESEWVTRRGKGGIGRWDQEGPMARAAVAWLDRGLDNVRDHRRRVHLDSS